MTTSSEDVLLQMAEVRYKKGDGTLYVMNERIAWMAENRDTVAVSHHFADIKMQKISPEGKPKVQLQLVLHDGSSSTFHFVNRKGVQATLDDRAKVRELLSQLLPNFKRKVDKDLEEKNRILSENPDLLQQYRDLVITNVLSSEEFWKICAKPYTMKSVKTQQDVGVPGSFLSGIKPIADGCNGLRYNLSGDIIQSIFRTYPAVKRKHEENVPEKMSESDFWVKFFQSHYFHRDRLTAGTKDIFSDCAKIDEQALKKAVRQSAGDALLDLRRLYDISPEEEYEADGGGAVVPSSNNIVHQNMIKRFNQHSMMVLQTSTSVLEGGGPVGIATAQAINKEMSNGAADRSKESKLKRKANNEKAQMETSEPGAFAVRRTCVIQEEAYEDLGRQHPKREQSDAKESKRPFILNKIERFFQGPLSTQSYEQGDDSYTLEQVRVNLLRQTEQWLQPGQPNMPAVNPHSAVNALGELSPGGALMRGFQEQSTAQLVPPQYEKEIRHLYMSVSRLLCDFWSSYPPNTPELETKIERAHDSIKKWQTVKLVPFENRALTDLQPLGASLTKHLNRMLQAVFTKYNNWQNRKQRQTR